MQSHCDCNPKRNFPPIMSPRKWSLNMTFPGLGTPLDSKNHAHTHTFRGYTFLGILLTEERWPIFTQGKNHRERGSEGNKWTFRENPSEMRTEGRTKLLLLFTLLIQTTSSPIVWTWAPQWEMEKMMENRNRESRHVLCRPQGPERGSAEPLHPVMQVLARAGNWALASLPDV